MLCHVILLLILCFGDNVFSKFDEDPLEKDWINPLDGFFGVGVTHEKIVDSETIKATDDNPNDHSQLGIRRTLETAVDSIGALVYSNREVNNLKSNVEYENDILVEKKLFLCNTFLKRFINLILQSTGLKNPTNNDGVLKEIPLKLKISEEALDVLRKFADGKSYSYDVLDEHLSQFLKFQILTNQDETEFFFVSNYNFALDSSSIIYILSIVLILISMYFLRKGLTFSSVITFLFFIFYVSCVGLDLWNQYEDAYAKRILIFEEGMSDGGKEKIPEECFPKKLSMYHFIFDSYISRESACDRYLKSKKSIWSELDVKKAFSGPIYGFLFSFIPELGDSAGKGVKNFSGHFPFPLNWIVVLCVIYLVFTTGFSTFIASTTFAIPRLLFRHQREEITYRTGDSTQNNQLPGSPSVQSGLTINYHLHNQQLPGFPQPSGDLSVVPKKTTGSNEFRKCQEQRRDRKRALLYSKIKKLK